MGIGSHTAPNKGATDEWLTPPRIVKALGEFDLDPCSPVDRPWDTAKRHYNIHDNGLILPWEGRVWLNPPYGPQTGVWLERLAAHGNGIALIFARTETKMFFRCGWNGASAMLFIEGRLRFCRPDGSIGGGSGGPSVLIAYGAENERALRESKIAGAIVAGWEVQ